MNRRPCNVVGFVIAQLIALIIVVQSYALNTDTHADINEYVVRTTMDGFSLDSYLKLQLGITDGIQNQIEGILDNKDRSFRVWQWLREGGIKEDSPWYDPFTRSANHYHNPLTNKGFSGVWGTRVVSGESSIVWAQKPPGAQSHGGNYSWSDVRGYFYNALTAADEATRQRNFADAFRGVGQLMHLVQDLSVPEHARDDGHYLPAYEKWVGGKNRQGNPNLNLSALVPVFFDSSAIGDTNPLAPVPVANLFDRNLYLLPNPDPSNTLRADIGLSEYTNANFLSPDTMFTSNFPYPRKEECILTVDSRNSRLYLSSRGAGQQVDHLATVSLLYFYRTTNFPQYNLNLPVALDPLCYEEYASHLIPRAVGYSSGLLKYFFRGTLEISAPDAFLYSIIDGSVLPQNFAYIKAKVKNTTPKEKNEQGEAVSYENMGPGTLVAVAKYKKRIDYQPDLSADPPTAESREADFSYSVSAPINIDSLSSETASEFTFVFNDAPIPAGITDLYLQIVFKGTLGNERDEAIAVGMKDLNEPMHVVLWNSTDRFYLYGQLYTPQQIRSNQELLDLIPVGFNIDPYNALETGAAFYIEDFPENYNAYTGRLSSGRFSRIIILTDMPSFKIFVGYYCDSPPKDSYFEETVNVGVINQEDEAGDFVTVPAAIPGFRGVKSHFWYTLWNFYPDNVGITSAPWPPAASPYPVPTDIYK